MRLSSSRVTALTHRPQQDFPLWEKSGTRPSLDLQFADRRDLVDATTGSNLVDFTRASSGTYVGSDGQVHTATTDEARFDHNPTTGESLGLLVEEQRTNLLRYSDQLDNETVWTQSNTEVTANQAISPDGTQTADLVEQLIAGVNDGVYQLVTGLTATAQYTFSFWARSNSPITVKTRIWDGNNSVTCNLTSEWKRFYVTETIPTTNVYALVQALQPGEQFYVWGAQLERGSFATSYIPTDGTPGGIVRGADVASITGTNFSSWYNQSEGTVFADITPVDVSALTILTTFNTTTFNQSHSIIKGDIGSSSPGFYINLNNYAGGIGAINFNSNNTGQRFKAAYSYKDSDLRASYDGGTISNTTWYNPSPTNLWFGQRDGGDFATRTHISRFTYWSVRLADTYLQELTQ